MSPKPRDRRTKPSKSGQVPPGDVRLVANIRKDIHKRLKIAAVQKDTSIGALLETILDKELP